MARRNTDQVYATLQQVQRRITEAAAGADLAADVPPAAPEREPQAPPAHPLQLVVPAAGAGAGHVRAPTVHPANPGVLSGPVPQATPPGGTLRATLQLSSELASFLVVLWLVTLAIAFFVGRSQMPRTIDPGADFAAGPAGHRDPAAAPKKAAAPATAGTNVLVLMSTRTVTPTEEQRFEAKRDELNQVATNAGGRYKPWFAVRKTRDGSLQLVWGSVDGKLGVDNDEWNWFRLEMEGAGYKGSYWLPLGDDK